jgi:hypothetical protein
VLRQLLTAAFIDQVAIRKDLVETDSTGNKYATAKGVPYKALGISEDVFIHPGSILFDSAPPDFVVFQEVVRTSQVWVKGVFGRLLQLMRPLNISRSDQNQSCVAIQLREIIVHLFKTSQDP